MALPNFRQSGSPGPMRKFSFTINKHRWKKPGILGAEDHLTADREYLTASGDLLVAWRCSLAAIRCSPLDTHWLPGSRANQCRQDQWNAHIRRKKSKELFMLFKLDISVYFLLLQFTFSPGFPSVNNLTINEAIKLHKLAKKRKEKKTC